MQAWEGEPPRKPYRRDVTDIEFLNLVRASLGKDPLPLGGKKNLSPLSEKERRALVAARSAARRAAARAQGNPVSSTTRTLLIGTAIVGGLAALYAATR